ncbi:TPA: hypothetical protein HA251_07485 [Candidatus Woesearchaeota archaeon]|nr:hypothetical protein [Candidatus Woesearchaeota archaeon]
MSSDSVRSVSCTGVLPPPAMCESEVASIAILGGGTGCSLERWSVDFVEKTPPRQIGIDARPDGRSLGNAYKPSHEDYGYISIDIVRDTINCVVDGILRGVIRRDDMSAAFAARVR